MELVLETCEIYSPHIEAKCLARNEKKAMDVLKQAMDELQKAKHQMLEKNYNELFNKYTEAFNTIKNKHVSEDKAKNNHLEHDVYKTAEGLYVDAGYPGAFLVHEGIYLKQNKATYDAKKLVDEGDNAISAAIRIAKLKGLDDALNAKARQKHADAAANEQETTYTAQATGDIDIKDQTHDHHDSGLHHHSAYEL